MSLTTAQLATVKAAILAETDPAFVAMRVAGATGAMAEWYSQPAGPAFMVWKTYVELIDVAAEVDGVELVGLTTGKLAAYQALLLPQAVNASKTRTRAGFDQVFSGAGGNITRPLLLALWKRSATRVEKLFATGTGSDASPATLVYEGGLSNEDVVLAINS